MEPVKISEVVSAIGGQVIFGDIKTQISGVSIDTRSLNPEELFIAIKGKRLDGHQFVEEALKKGAQGLMVEKDGVQLKGLPPRVVVIEVTNTKEALLSLAAWYRKRFNPKVVAVTGSNGKTTTKEMINFILTPRFRVVSAPASFNNEIGVPLAVLRIDHFTEVAVFEIEMNELGGTWRLAEVCQPNIGVITNIGDTHLEFMKDRQGVAKEKKELIEALPKDGVAVVNFDDPLALAAVSFRRNDLKVVTFGFKDGADVFATGIKDYGTKGSEFLLLGKYPVRLPVPGRHNIANFLGSLAVARELGMGVEEILKRSPFLTLPPQRLSVMRLPNLVLIDDSFNANPQSMAAALEVLCASADRAKRVAILGDMLELGESSILFHQELGKRAGGCVDRLVVIGKMAPAVIDGALSAGMTKNKIRCYQRAEEVGAELFDIFHFGDTILVKGSRKMALEKIVQMIVRRYGEKAD